MAILHTRTVVNFNGVGKPQSAALQFPLDGKWNGTPIKRLGARLRIEPQYIQAPIAKYGIEFYRLKYGTQQAWQQDAGQAVLVGTWRSEPANPLNPPPNVTGQFVVTELAGKFVWVQVSSAATVDENDMPNEFPCAVDIMYLDDDDGTDFPLPA